MGLTNIKSIKAKAIWISSIILLLSCSHTPITKKSGDTWYFDAVNGPLLRAKNQQVGQNYGVASQGKGATSAAKKMFDLGGNAADAAAAASFAISVERPQSTGLGGGGFLLYFHPSMKNGPVAYDFREVAPSKATKEMFVDAKGEVIPDKSITGIHAVGVPGMVAGIVKFQRRFGKLPLATIVAPAIEMAEQGIAVYPELAEAIEEEAPRLLKFEASKKLFFKNNQPLKVGDILIQKDLARTLEAIGNKGVAGFYSGDVAKKIAAYSRQLKWPISLQDLQTYLVKERKPIKSSFAGNTFFSMSPPSSGGAHIAQIIGMAYPYLNPAKGPMDPLNVHVTASSMQMAFFDRARYMGDPDFVKIPLETLVSEKYLTTLGKKIDLKMARASDNFNDWPDAVKFNQQVESNQTTHFSILTKDGEAVVSTQTINGHFGSAIVVPGTGVVLNNEMDDFATKVGASNLYGAVGGENNLPEANKRPLSSMSPTLVFRKGKPILALGTPSGTRILTCVTQTIINRLVYGLDLYDSVATLRFHHQWKPDNLFFEERGFPLETSTILTAMNHHLEKKDLGCRIQAVELNDNTITAVSDPRGEGASLAF